MRMAGYFVNLDKFKCCGCRACEQACPASCIHMFEDEEGFLYPEKVREICNNCGICEKVCPFISKEELDLKYESSEQHAYLAIHKDENTILKSASGGAFSAIVETFCIDNFAVFGSEMDDNLLVKHSYAETIHGTHKYRRSKYVQSNIGETFKEAEHFLIQGKNVLFTGTPCQIAGLLLYLKKNYDNLFCVDIICNGVPSQKIFNLYKDYLEQKYNGNITEFSFRHKTYSLFHGYNSKNIKAIIGKKIIVKNSQNDIYLKAYHSGLFNRPSCYQCKYANPNRISDITIGDFWRVEELYPDKEAHKGISIMIANTAKGRTLVSKMQNLMMMEEIDKELVIKRNGRLNNPSTIHPKREEFFNLLKYQQIDGVVDRCIPRATIARVIWNKAIPKKVKSIIIKILRGLVQR